MEESSTELQKRIERYKEYVEKSVAQGDDHKLLQTIRKLNKLPITVSHLQDTGVGRTINSLRKLEGSIGKESRDLVQKWRNMVMVEEDNSEETENDIHSSEETSVKEKSHSSKNNNEENHREDKSSKESRHDKYDKPERKDESSKRNKYDSDKYNKYDKNDKNDKYDKNDRSNNEKNHNHKHDKNSANSSHSHSDDNKKHKNKEKKSEEKEKDKIREKEKNRDRDKDLKQKEKDKDKEREKDRDKDRHNDKKRKREESSSREKKHRYESSDENCSENEDYEENNYSSHKQNSASHSSEKKEKSSSDKYKSSKSDKKEKESSHHNSKNSNKSSSNSSSSSKNNSNSIGGSTSSTSSSKTSHDSSKDKSSRDKKSESNSNSKNSDSTNISSSSTSNKKEIKFKTPSKSSSNSKSKKDKDENSDEEGICSSSGASFAEALGMMESVPTIRSVKKKEKTKPTSPIPSTSKEKSTSTKPSSYSSSSSSHTSSNNKADSPLSTSPALLTSNVKLEPLDLNISSELPQITTNYKPLPTTFDLDAFNKYGLKSDMTEEEALSRVISSKTQRTKVYSGNKTWRYVPSLFNLCVKILQENIDSLEYTGGVPYSILKPVLERATAEQLFNAEHYNPYLIDDTDELWECICKKQFRGKIPGEMESWRDMYLRCVDEREVKLRSLTATIKQSQEIKKAPVRQTKLAYVDTVAKPPRAVAKKQAKYGTGSSNNTPLITPTARLNAVAAPKSNNSITVPAPVQRVSHSGAVMKPKKAPLMQKALAAIKSRFRR